MKCNVSQLYTHCGYLIQQFLGEVQARRGGGSGAVDLGVHRLVALLVLKLLLDIGGQGHFPQPLQHLQENPLIIEAHQAVAAGQLLHHLRRQFPVAEGQLRPGAHPLARPHQALPGLVPPVDQQQHLARAAAGQPVAQQTGRKHPGIIEDQAVAGPEILRKIVKIPVLPRAGVLVQHQQPGGVPLGDGRLGDQLRW